MFWHCPLNIKSPGWKVMIFVMDCGHIYLFSWQPENLSPLILRNKLKICKKFWSLCWMLFGNPRACSFFMLMAKKRLERIKQVLIAYASAQSRRNLRCSLIQAVSQEEPSDRKPYPWPLWMAGHAQLKFVMTECSKTQISLDGAQSLIRLHRCVSLSEP